MAWGHAVNGMSALPWQLLQCRRFRIYDLVFNLVFNIVMWIYKYTVGVNPYVDRVVVYFITISFIII